MKINIPASSETGNIPLHTRYENYSTVYPNKKSNNPNDLVFNSLYKDLLAEAFSNESPIQLKDASGNVVGPIDRFSDMGNPSYIGHGSVYHDISKTVSTLQSSSFYSPVEYTPTTELAFGRVPPLHSIVNTQIITDGKNADAGGRSVSVNLDGMLELNVGANTVDRQSIWLDTQGGVVANVGRDLQNVSVAAHLDGQLIIQVGGETVPAETNRFQNSNTGWMAGAVDIRVFNSQKELTIFRIDDEGLTVTSPGRIVMYSAQKMQFRSDASIEFDADSIILAGRQVTKDPGAGSIR
jgi:hypothetical protein